MSSGLGSESRCWCSVDGRSHRYSSYCDLDGEMGVDNGLDRSWNVLREQNEYLHQSYRNNVYCFGNHSPVLSKCLLPKPNKDRAHYTSTAPRPNNWQKCIFCTQQETNPPWAATTNHAGNRPAGLLISPYRTQSSPHHHHSSNDSRMSATQSHIQQGNTHGTSQGHIIASDPTHVRTSKKLPT